MLENSHRFFFRIRFYYGEIRKAPQKQIIILCRDRNSVLIPKEKVILVEDKTRKAHKTEYSMHKKQINFYPVSLTNGHQNIKYYEITSFS